MKTNLTICVRAFPVKVYDHNTSEERTEQIILTKEQLQAAQLVGQSSKELIERLYTRQGYKVLEIGAPDKREISMDLSELYRLHSLAKERSDHDT